jgi:hypothetical protein
MPKHKQMPVPDSAIHLINSLGGPPLPTGVPPKMLNVIMENFAASQAPASSCRVAAALAGHRH